MFEMGEIMICIIAKVFLGKIRNIDHQIPKSEEIRSGICFGVDCLGFWRLKIIQ